MKKLMDLDIESIRKYIRQLSRDVIDALSERSRFKQNLHLYDGVGGSLHTTPFEYALIKGEEYNCSIGRYLQDGEFPITGVSTQGELSSQVQSVPHTKPNGKEAIINFYNDIIKEVFLPGIDKGKEADILDKDLEAITRLNRRINIGQYVAENKIQRNLDAISLFWNPTKTNYRARLDFLVDKNVEAEVISRAKEYAFIRGLDEEKIDKVFRRVIDETLRVEMDYLTSKYSTLD